MYVCMYVCIQYKNPRCFPVFCIEVQSGKDFYKDH